MIKESKQLKDLADKINIINVGYPNGKTLLNQLWGIHNKLTKHEKIKLTFQQFCKRMKTDILNAQ